MAQVSFLISAYFPTLLKFIKIFIKFPTRLRPFENEVVSGEMRVQITFEQSIVRNFSST